MKLLTKTLIKKYDIEGPRYTSYPTAPVWKRSFSYMNYRDTLASFSKKPEPISLYIHIPFCKNRCLFCACNVVIRKSNQSFGDEYIKYLEKEMKLIRQHLGFKAEIKQLHLGGGTPTFLSDDQLMDLSHRLDTYFDTSQLEEKAIEIDPRFITTESLDNLKQLGFNRLSFGIQDFNKKVQESIHRIQDFKDFKILFDHARQIGFSSINCDLIYGLPYQTPTRFKETIEKVIDLKPDRIALYSYAHVPWIHSHQNLIKQSALPDADEKINLFLQARNQFLDNDYTAIAMDHFALKNDDLAHAYQEGRLKRNFMGYTTLSTRHYLGLGTSSIGNINHAFIQNTKDINQYYESLDNNVLPTERGYSLSSTDVINQWVISRLMCQFKIHKQEFFETFDVQFDSFYKDKAAFLEKTVKEGLIKQTKSDLTMTQLGRLFVRNICMGFDEYLPNKRKNQFSKTV